MHGWIGGDGFRHYAYHGYYTLDYSSIDANMGTKEQFKEFVETALKNGIRVILDVVLNHGEYASLKDMHEYGIDGVRGDTAKHVEKDKWKELKSECTKALKEWKEANPDKKVDDKEFWMTAEVWGQGVGRNDYYDNGCDSLINFDFQNSVANIKNIDSTYERYARKINSDSEPNLKINPLSYISSHDTSLYDRGDLIDGGTALLLVPGAAQIFYGDETARPLAFEDCPYKDQKNRSDMNWKSENKDVLSHWQKLGVFRRAHLSVGAGKHEKISDAPYTFSRKYDKDGVQDKVVCVIGAEKNTIVDVSSVFDDGTKIRDAYTGKTSTVESGKVTFKADKNGVVLIEQAK